MFEMTHGGAWFRWSAMDGRFRALAVGSVVCAGLAGVLLAMAAAPVSRRWHFDLSSYAPSLATAGLVLAGLSALLWYLLSRAQDEMFYRCQTWALGMAGGWTCAVVSVWGLLAKVSLAVPLPSLAPAFIFLHAAALFWFVAVRRWAS